MNGNDWYETDSDLVRFFYRKESKLKYFPVNETLSQSCYVDKDESKGIIFNECYKEEDES